MKYIDSEKLIAEIERRKQIHKSNVENGFPDEANKITEDNNILSIIASLQQEQPEFPTTDEEIERALASIPKVELPDKYKTPDWLFKQQEQPEVNLEKEIHRFFEECIEVYEVPLYGKVKERVISVDCYEITAYHFYELGQFNARKEE